LQESATARAATPPRAIQGEAMRARTARALATSSRGARAGAEQLTAAIRSGRIHAQVDKKKGAKSKRKRFFFFLEPLGQVPAFASCGRAHVQLSRAASQESF
jgi:hypothetical protein